MDNNLSLFGDNDQVRAHENASADALPRDLALLALAEIQGVGHTTALKLYSATNLASLFRATRDQLLWIATTAEIPSPDGFADSFITQRDDALKLASEHIRRYERLGVRVIFDDDDLYPNSLRPLSDRPRWLICRGNAELLNAERLITVVGTRKPSKSGLRLAERVSGILVERGFAIVSGLAEGIDAVAHRATLSHGQTIAVLGTGIFSDFPAATASLRTPILNNGGAIITEYFDKEQYSRQRFVQRNRIQAALSRMTIPIEAGVPSGTLHTIGFAKRYGKVVLGVRWESQPESDLHNFLEDEGFDVVTIPAVDDPLLTALGRSYEFASFIQKSRVDRGNAIIARVVGFARRLIKVESLSKLEIERIVRGIQEDFE